jgi:hypothetical protein
MFNISFDVTYKLKMGFIVVQKHDNGISKWRILDDKLETCFFGENLTETNWITADMLILDPSASYSFEPVSRNKNDWN